MAKTNGDNIPITIINGDELNDHAGQILPIRGSPYRKKSIHL